MKKTKVYLRAYFNDNLGDDLFVHIIAGRYNSADIYCLRSDKQLVHFPENVKGVCNLRDRLFYRKCRLKNMTEESGRYDAVVESRAMEKADVVVFAIGSGFMEDHYPFWREGRDRAFYKKKPYLIGCNFGPYETDAFLATHIKYFKRCADVCFRDSYSDKLFSGIGRHEADIVFSYTGEKAYEELAGVRYQVIAPRGMDEEAEGREEYIAFMKECISEASKNGIKTVLIPFCNNQGDGKICDELACDDTIRVNYPEVSAAKIAGIIRAAERVIAVRYHSAVLALLYSVPVCIIAYSEKTTNVMADIDGNIKVLNISDINTVSADSFLKDYVYEISDEKIKELKESSERQFSELDKALVSVT